MSLPAGPLLDLVCLAAQRHLTAAWLTLASILIAQLNPPSFLSTIKSGPTAEAQAIVSNTLPILLQTSLRSLAQPGAMEAVREDHMFSIIAQVFMECLQNPDVVQEFFTCMDRVQSLVVSLTAQ